MGMIKESCAFDLESQIAMPKPADALFMKSKIIRRNPGFCKGNFKRATTFCLFIVIITGGKP